MIHKHAFPRRALQWLVLVAAVAVLWCLIGDFAEARPHHHRRSGAAAARARRDAAIRAATGQRAAAEQVLAAATVKGAGAQAKLNSSLAKLTEASNEMKQAHELVHGLQGDLRDIEQEILGEQAPDSTYAKAKAELESAKRALEGVKSKVLADQTNRDPETVQMQPGYLVARARVEQAARDIERTRRELFQQDEDWKETSESLAEARKAVSEAEKAVASSGASRLGPLQNLRKAEDVAAVARSALAQSEAVLRGLNASPKPSNSANSNKQRKK